MTVINSWLKEYASNNTAQSPNVTALKALNFLMAIQTAVVGILLLGPGELFLQPSSPPDQWWLSPVVGAFEVWEIVFILGSIFMAIATSALKWVIPAHAFLAICWLGFGLVWTIGGILNSPSYLFGVGILGIFIALQHVGLIGVWRAEGI